jgi:hypothetical protein
MNPHRHRCSPHAVALGLLACAALAAPAAADAPSANDQQPSTAKIGDTPADYPGGSQAPIPPVSKAGDTPADYPGTRGAPAAGELAGAASTRPGELGGFDWPSAAIGAAGGGLLIVLSLGAVSVLSHRRTRVAR